MADAESSVSFTEGCRTDGSKQNDQLSQRDVFPDVERVLCALLSWICRVEEVDLAVTSRADEGP